MVCEVGGGGGGLSTVRGAGVRGGGRWKSKQNNLAQWELRCAGVWGVEGGAEQVVTETVDCPRPGLYPQSSTTLLSLSWKSLSSVFSRAQV